MEKELEAPSRPITRLRRFQKTFTRLLLKADILKEAVWPFKVRGKSSIPSLPGSVISLFIIGFLLAFTIIKLLNMSNGLDSTLKVTHSNIGRGEVFGWDQTNFQVAYFLAHKDTEEVIPFENITRYLTVNAYLVTRNSTDSVETPLDMQSCDQRIH